MQSIIQNLSAYMMVGIVIVIAVSQVNRLVGAVLGVLFWTAVAIVGSQAYAMDGAIGIGNIRFSAGFFYVLCGILVVFNVALGWNAWQKRPRPTYVESSPDTKDTGDDD